MPTPQRPVPILTYHQIDSPAPPQTPYRGLSVAPAAFARQMAMLAALGYQGLSMSALQPYLRGEKHGKVVGITLDDGYLNNLQFALPVLQRHGFTATCYVVSAMLGKTNAWDEPLGVPAKALMAPADLMAWIAGGQEVGAHSRKHNDLTQIDEAAARLEIAGCKDDLERLLQVEIRHFCYPYGRYAPAHVLLAQQAGYATATTTRRGRCQPDARAFELPRVPVLRSTSLPLLWLKLATGYEDRRS
jgi:peptidoglycan/xylan/chitin deacetylase (PgdA/CDA1 family)